MVDKNVLSQEEIDALLKTVGENSENQDSEGAEGTKEAVRNKKASSHKKQVTEAVFETIEVKKKMK